MIAGGTHSMIHPLGVMGFNLLTALSTSNEHPTKASRPFDKERNGFVIAEGSGMVILEEYERAKSRGAKYMARSPVTGLRLMLFASPIRIPPAGGRSPA